MACPAALWLPAHVTFLPIVERELRVASRRASTFRIRFLAASAATLLGGLQLAASQLPGPFAPQGKGLFLLLVHLQFLAALLAGAFLTADCLSRERREGTLGFLFLTDLDGFDVVAGKFAALGLQPLHALLAVVPITALTVMLGGVAGSEFWRATLVVLNTTFVSMAVGLWISSVVDDERQAVVLTLVVMGIVVGAPEALAGVARLGRTSLPLVGIRLAGPYGLLRAALGSSTGLAVAGYGWGLLYQHAVGWLLVLLAARVVHRSWRRDPPSRRMNRRPSASGGKQGAGGVSSWADRARRERLWGAGPLGWLAWRGSWVRRALPWVTGITAVAAVLAGLLCQPWGSAAALRSAAESSGWILEIGLFGLKLLVVVHTVYFLQDACRTGMMEMVLTTPVSGRWMKDGHFAAMREIFLGPVLVLVLLQVGVRVGGRILEGGDWPSPWVLVWTALVPALWGAGLHAVDFLAAAYRASVHAFRHDRPANAVLRSAAVVLLLPRMFCGDWRVVVLLPFLSRDAARLVRFRELLGGWFFPESLGGRAFGEPRVGQG